MKHNGKKVNFSDKALGQIEQARKCLDYLEGLIERDAVKDDTDRELFVLSCDNAQACLEHLKSEVINNDN